MTNKKEDENLKKNLARALKNISLSRNWKRPLIYLKTVQKEYLKSPMIVVTKRFQHLTDPLNRAMEFRLRNFA